MSQQAVDARALLDHLGVDRAHVVGHSYGGAIALQLALDAPERVASLALLEPAGIVAPSREAFAQEVLAFSDERYARGDKSGAVELFLQGVCGPQMREVADQALPPGAYDQAAADADTFFSARRAGARESGGLALPRRPASPNRCCSCWEPTPTP